MTGDEIRLDPRQFGHVSAIRTSADWAAKRLRENIVIQQKPIRQMTQPRHERIEAKPRVMAETSQTRRYITEALTSAPKGMTCASICQAKRLQKKASEQMLAKMHTAGLLKIVGYKYNGMGTRMARIYQLEVAK